MARKKAATPAETGAGDAKSDTPPEQGGGESKPTTTKESTTVNIDFATGLPTNATPAETGGQSQVQAQQPIESQPATPPTGGGQESQVFTQDDVNRILNERLDRERKKFADYDTLKAAADELATLKGEQEAEERTLTEKMAGIQSEVDATKLELQAQRLRNEILVKAAKLGLNDPADAYLLVDMTSLGVDEDTGGITGVDEALERLKTDKPYLFQRGAIRVEPANASRSEQPGRTDADRWQDYFGGGGGGFWGGGGLRVVDREDLE